METYLVPIESNSYLGIWSKNKEVAMDKDLVHIYIRHIGERTVPILKWYFKDYKITLLCGKGKTFFDLYKENLLRIINQKEPYAIVVDGDIVPVVDIKTLLKVLLVPLMKNKDLITVNGTRIDRFLYYPGFQTGGFKSYSVRNAWEYLSKLDKSALRPESYLYKTVGRYYQVKGKILCGHEYGQYLWHVYNKAFLRGVKSKALLAVRRFDDEEFEVYLEGLKAGISSTKRELFIYDRGLLPNKYRSIERTPISYDRIEETYFNLLKQIKSDIRESFNVKKICKFYFNKIKVSLIDKNKNFFIC